VTVSRVSGSSGVRSGRAHRSPQAAPPAGRPHPARVLACFSGACLHLADRLWAGAGRRSGSGRVPDRVFARGDLTLISESAAGLAPNGTRHLLVHCTWPGLARPSV